MVDVGGIAVKMVLFQICIAARCTLEVSLRLPRWRLVPSPFSSGEVERGRQPSALKLSSRDATASHAAFSEGLFAAPAASAEEGSRRTRQMQ